MPQAVAAAPPARVHLPPGWAPASFLLTGDTSTGKSSQAVEMAMAMFTLTGGKVVNGEAVGGLRTRWYSLMDNFEPARNLIEWGVIELHDMALIPHIIFWLSKVGQGMVPMVTGEKEDGTLTGLWKKGDPSNIGLYVFDSLSSAGDALMAEYQALAKAGVNIGGMGMSNYDVGSTDWGGTEKVGSNNQAHFGEAQRKLTDFTDKMSQLVARTGAMAICTAVMRRDSNESGAALLGPSLAGKALTAEYPRRFTYACNLVRAGDPGKSEMGHELRFDTMKDMQAGGAMMLANRRLPLVKGLTLPPVVYKPADLPKAYADIVAYRLKAKEVQAKALA